jgi:hypothetical protein
LEKKIRKKNKVLETTKDELKKKTKKRFVQGAFKNIFTNEKISIKKVLQKKPEYLYLIEE